MEQYLGVFSGDERNFGEDVDELPGVGVTRRVAPGETGEPSKLRLQKSDGFSGIGNPRHLGKDGTEHVMERSADEFLPQFVLGASVVFVCNGLFRMYVVAHCAPPLQV